MSETRQDVTGFTLVRTAFEKALSIFIGVLLAGMVVVVFGNVIFRYFLNASLAWSEEVSRFMLIWLAFLGAIIAYIKNEHLGLDILVRYLPKLASRSLVVFADVLVLVALGYMVKGGIDMTVDSFASGWVASAVPIPYGYVYMVAPISAGFMLLEGIIKTIEDVILLVHDLKGGT